MQLATRHFWLTKTITQSVCNKKIFELGNFGFLEQDLCSEEALTFLHSTLFLLAGKKRKKKKKQYWRHIKQSGSE